MLSKLHHTCFNRISRAADMLCLFLGEDYSFISERGKRVEAAEYSLHVQSQWRFRESGTILLASQDVYEPYNENVSEGWKYDIIGRTDEQSSVFDVQARSLMHKMCGAYVKQCYLTIANDIVIEFSNGITFEQFTAASRKSEEWRLIDYKNNQHMICYDDGNISCQ